MLKLSNLILTYLIMETKEKTKYKVTFMDIFESEDLEKCYEQLLDYLTECVENKDVSAFQILTYRP